MNGYLMKISINDEYKFLNLRLCINKIFDSKIYLLVYHKLEKNEQTKFNYD